MTEEKYKRFPLAIQLTVPSLEEIDTFKNTLKSLRECGIEGLELNIPDLSEMQPMMLKKILDESGLNLFNIASGRLAMKEGLSLTTTDGSIRSRSVERLKDMIDYASYFDCGIILGFIKGGPNQDSIISEKNLIEALGNITKLAEEKSVPIIIEATNHYETSVAITLESAVRIAETLGSHIYRILPDTYHMNIEEISSYSAMQKYVQYFDHIHISDNNRFYPGLGAIDFKQTYMTLINLGFNGYLGIEGNNVKSVEEDVKITVDLLRNIVESIEYMEY